MVEWTALEMRRTGDCTLGSNPSLSATEKQNRDVVLLFVLHLFYRLSCVAQSKPVYLHRVTNNNLNTIYHETLICSAPFKHVLDRASPSATLSESRVEC